MTNESVRFDVRASSKSQNMQVLLGKKMPPVKAARRIIQWGTGVGIFKFEDLAMVYLELSYIFDSENPRAEFDRYKTYFDKHQAGVDYKGIVNGGR